VCPHRYGARECQDAYRWLREQRPENREVAWVLVRDPLPGHGLRYLTVHKSGWFDWTEDHMAALRLARRQDADSLGAVVEDADRVEEHMWISP
jgi:hypothetical protein